MYTGEAFGKLSSKSDTITNIREKFMKKSESQKNEGIEIKLENKEQNDLREVIDEMTEKADLYCLKGTLQKIMIQISNKVEVKNTSIYEFVHQNNISHDCDQLRNDAFATLKIFKIVSCYEFLE